MRIKIEDYIIYGSGDSIILAQIIQGKDGKERQKEIGYFGYGIEEAIESLLNEKIKKSTATTLKELQEDILQAKEELLKALDSYELIENFNEKEVEVEEED